MCQFLHEDGLDRAQGPLRLSIVHPDFESLTLYDVRSVFSDLEYSLTEICVSDGLGYELAGAGRMDHTYGSWRR